MASRCGILEGGQDSLCLAICARGMPESLGCIKVGTKKETDDAFAPPASDPDSHNPNGGDGGFCPHVQLGKPRFLLGLFARWDFHPVPSCRIYFIPVPDWHPWPELSQVAAVVLADCLAVFLLRPYALHLARLFAFTVPLYPNPRGLSSDHPRKRCPVPHRDSRAFPLRNCRRRALCDLACPDTGLPCRHMREPSDRLARCVPFGIRWFRSGSFACPSIPLDAPFVKQLDQKLRH